jgi:hypothetical protein
MVNKPDLIDIIQDWLIEHHPSLYREIVTQACTDGKIIILYRIDPRSDVMHFVPDTGEAREIRWDRNYLFTLSVGGTLWRHYLGEVNAHRDIDIKLNPADPNVFNVINDVIVRRLNADR